MAGSYALRNAPDLDKALSEVRRILRPGGVAAFLDFSRPSPAWLQLAEYWLLKAWGGFWGLMLLGNPEVYAYIAESLAAFPDRAQLRERVSNRGLMPVQQRRFYFGVLQMLFVKA